MIVAPAVELAAQLTVSVASVPAALLAALDANPDYDSKTTII